MQMLFVMVAMLFCCHWTEALSEKLCSVVFLGFISSTGELWKLLVLCIVVIKEQSNIPKSCAFVPLPYLSDKLRLMGMTGQNDGKCTVEREYIYMPKQSFFGTISSAHIL